jgi:hypothetical protein
MSRNAVQPGVKPDGRGHGSAAAALHPLEGVTLNHAQAGSERVPKDALIVSLQWYASR